MSEIIRWREWGEEAFAEAQASDKPILLDIHPVWSRSWPVMEAGIPGDPVHTGTYRDPDVQERIQRNFVPVRVDAEQRPDIERQYSVGGWHTTAFLTPSGDGIHGVNGCIDPETMIQTLDWVVRRYRTDKAGIAQRVALVRQERIESDAARPAGFNPDTWDSVLRLLTATFSTVYGGFGGESKYPEPEKLRLVLEQYAQVEEYGRVISPRLRTMAAMTLHGMADGGMYDQSAGGFFSCSLTPDWTKPEYAKMLEDNAKLMSLYCFAYQVLGDPYYLDVVKSAQKWLFSEMYDPQTGGFAGSQGAGAEDAYYGQPLEVRAALPPPFTDRTVFTDFNAAVVSALVNRYKITQEPEILAAARKTFVLFGPSLPMQKEYGQNLPHCFISGRPQGAAGLLQDQAAVMQAALDLFDVTGDRYYADTARLVGDGLLAVMQAPEGGFFDVVPTPNPLGPPGRPFKYMKSNTNAALALLRLSGYTQDIKYKSAAAEALVFYAAVYNDGTTDPAPYARAVAALFAHEVHITVAGDPGSEETWKLQQEAWAFVAQAKTVISLTPQEAVQAGLLPPENGAAYAVVRAKGATHPPVPDPAGLTRLLITQGFPQLGRAVRG